MALAIWQQTIVDEAGDLLPGATVTVRRETPGQPLAPIKSDRAGDTAKENPFTADVTTAEALFYVTGGAYKIEIVSGDFSRTLRYVAIGRGAEADITGLTPKGDWATGTTYDTGDLVTHSGRTFASNEDDNEANTPPTSDASDTHWTWIPATPGQDGSSDVVGTSETSLSIATGSKAFTIVEEDRGWAAGARLRASSDANPDRDYMEGVVTAYALTTLTLDIDLVGGSGTLADWTINLAGEQGVKGDTGDTGATGPQGDTGIGIAPQGEWIGATTYAADDGVTHQGSFWRSLQAGNLNNDPAVSPAFWEETVAKGDTGPAGPATSVDRSVRVATTANITLSGEQTIDGVSAVTGDQALVKDQSAPAENGVYVVASGAWARDGDYDTWVELVGALIGVEEGTVGADSIWMCTADDGGTLETTAVTFAQRYGSATESAEGLVELATEAEVQTGTDTARAVTPAGAASAFPLAEDVRAIVVVTETEYSGLTPDANTFYLVTADA